MECPGSGAFARRLGRALEWSEQPGGARLLLTAGASEVEADDGGGQPGGVRGVAAGGQVCQRSVLELGDDLLDDGVVALSLVGLDGAQGAVGGERTVPPGGEQLARGGAVAGQALQPIDPPDHQPAGDVLGLAAAGEPDEIELDDLGIGHQRPPAWS